MQAGLVNAPTFRRISVAPCYDLRLYRLPHALEPHGRQFFQTLTLGIDCDAYGF